MVVPVPTDATIVFLLILAAVVLFATEYFTPDVTAITIIVALVVLEPWTGVGTETAVSGFANVATITVAAMYMLSEGIHRTGLVRVIRDSITEFAGDSTDRLQWTTLSLTGGLAGVINNTPVVAVFIPMVMDLADEYQLSPSKLLIPLSYASVLGGTLTLVGTSTNLLASSFSDRLLGHPFSMFEFTHLGFLVLVVGIAYMGTVGQRLLPERVKPTVDLLGAFSVTGHISRLYVRETSPLAGEPLGETLPDKTVSGDLDVLEVVRYDGRHAAPGPEFVVESGDILTMRGDRDAIREVATAADLWYLPWVHIEELGYDIADGTGTLVEVEIPQRSPLVGESVGHVHFRQRYEATILAIERGDRMMKDSFEDVVFEPGDTLLLRTAGKHVDALRDDETVTVTTVATEGLLERPATDAESYREDKQFRAVAIIAGVIGAAALGVISIAISALAGVVAMVGTGVLDAEEAYDAVSWDVIFLLAGMIPLGIALEQSGGAALIADWVVGLSREMPALAVLFVLSLVTTGIANFVSPNATVVILLPVAVDIATQLGANAFAFVLAVTFAANATFLTPVGYQTNLMVYRPGGYRFGDYVRVGAPLQLVLAVVTVAGIWLFWGI